MGAFLEVGGIRSYRSSARAGSVNGFQSLMRGVDSEFSEGL